MFIYYGKRYDAAKTGSTIVGVTCDKCGCEYCYEFTRTGAGASEAPYGIGKGGAARSAQDQAERDLLQRLATEADLVPCPRCNWINEELVEGYRRGRYRSCLGCAFAVAAVGIVGALVCAWFISVGPPADRGAVTWILFGGPAVFISLGVSMIAARNWLRRRIRPNQNYPQPPQVLPGTPRALIKDARGQLRPADPFDVNDGVDVKLGQQVLPPTCCLCLQSATLTHAYRLTITTSSELAIPRCASCAGQAKRAVLGLFVLILTIGYLVGVGVPFLLGLESLTIWLLIALAAVVYPIFVFMIAAAITSPVKLVPGDLPPGVVRLRFRNSGYARLVAEGSTDPHKD